MTKKLCSSPLRARLLAGALLVPSLVGCGALSTHEQCEEIAEVLDRSKAALAEPLTINPPASKLTARADSYRELGSRLKRLRLDKELDKSRDVLVRHLQALAQHLSLAAQAVTEASKDGPAADTVAPAASSPAPAPAPNASPQRPRQRAQLRRYMQAKTEIEAASVRITEAMQKLSHDCH